MGVLEWDGAMFLVGNIYLKLGYEKGVTEFGVEKCGKDGEVSGCKRIITMGTATVDIYHGMRRQTRTAKL